MTVLSKDEWARRYAEAIIRITGLSREAATDIAAAALYAGAADDFETPEEAVAAKWDYWVDNEGAAPD